MSSTLQNAAKRGDVNISKKAAKDHQHSQTENETQKLNYQTFPQEHKRSKNGKKNTQTEEGKPTGICKHQEGGEMSKFVGETQ